MMLAVTVFVWISLTVMVMMFWRVNHLLKEAHVGWRYAITEWERANDRTDMALLKWQDAESKIRELESRWN